MTVGDVDLEALELGYAAPEYSDGRVPQFRFRRVRVLAGNHVQIESWGRASPPQVEIDRPRATVFSLGCILWEMLAGRPLFVGSTDYETVQLARAANVPPLSGVDPELEAIVTRALAKNVDSRYQPPSQLADALADHLVARTSN